MKKMDAPINITVTFPAFELAFSVLPCKDIFLLEVKYSQCPKQAFCFPFRISYSYNATCPSALK
jgi:hypothetical protein